jgi:hypothetical protein
MVLLSCAVWIDLNGRLTVAVAADNTLIKEQEFEGYLITEHSTNDHDDSSKISKECIQMPECSSSGYGISVKQDDGKYRFFKFDGNGQELAKEILAKTAKTNGIIVIAKGILEGEILKVVFLQEKAIQTPRAIELNGWLIDKCCSGTKNPVKHSLECLRMESCAATGFGILEKQRDGSFKFYQFDEKGHNLAVNYLKKVTQKDNIVIFVKGVWDGNILKVSILTEKK